MVEINPRDPNQFEFGKFFSDPLYQSYLHIIKPITHIQLWKIMLAILAFLFQRCVFVEECHCNIKEYPGGWLAIKLGKLVYEQVIFKIAGWLAMYLLAYLYYYWNHQFRASIKPIKEVREKEYPDQENVYDPDIEDQKYEPIL